MKKSIFFMAFTCLFLTFSATVFAQFTPPRILKHPAQIRLERIDVLNSTFRETNLNVSPDGKYLFFMSGRGGQIWSKARPNFYGGRMEHDGDIWFSQKIGGRWAFPQCLGSNVNTNDGEDEPNISPDGQKITFQSWGRPWQTTGGPYYQSSLNGTTWGFATGLGGGINAFFLDKEKAFYKRYALDTNTPNDYGTDGVTLSPDGKIFIVAVGEYDGNMDLYISRKNAYGVWSYPKRLPISTLGDERSPFLAGDGKTLYFASDGYGGWGGLDIFKTVLNDNDTCGEIVNIGAPFNNWEDDYGFILTASGNDAYFVREGDIYYADTKDALPEMKPSSSTLMIAGVITNTKTQKGIGATIKIINPATKLLIAQTQSNAVTGEYAIMLPLSAINFAEEVTKTGFESGKQTFNIQIKTGLNKVESNIALKPIEKPVEVVVVIEKPKEAAAAMGIDEDKMR
jgi:Tol biopolymer transport system component